MLSESSGGKNTSNIISMDSFRSRQKASRLIRIAPEMDGLEMLYSNDTAQNRMFSLKILFWGLRENGDVIGLVPWLRDIVACTELNDPLNGHWEGYHDPGINRVFHQAPKHKIVELESSAEYYRWENADTTDILQELPDSLGTHAVMTHNGFRSFILTEVVSWRLYGDGHMEGMLIDESRMKSTPVLPGDTCLYPANHNPEFRYYFQHRIANKIKEHDPETLAAMYTLIE